MNLINTHYSFGMVMPGRTYSSLSYRYGFNGKEKDPNITSEDYDYGMRIYDARSGRFLSVDPLQKKYPWYTPYQFAGNTPLQAVDLDGLEEYYYSGLWNKKTGKTEFKLEKIESQKSFLGYDYTPAEKVIVTFKSSDGDKTKYTFTPEGHIVRNNGINEHVNTIASFEAFKKGSADKVYSSEVDAKFAFGGDGGTGGFYSSGALVWNFIGNASKDFHDHGGAYTLNAKINSQTTRVNGGNTTAEKQNGSQIKPGITAELVREAHSQLDPTAQKYKTTAIGIDKEGKLYLSSSDKTVPKIQRDWATSKGIAVVNGNGHAEETLMSNSNVVHIDASRGVCIDCENQMNNQNVTTNTSPTGKKSRNRQ